MRTGWIGLGSLGAAMAGRLRETGTELVVWNRTRAKAEALRSAGGAAVSVAASPADLASRCETIVLSLADSAAVAAVLDGEAGLLARGLAAGGSNGPGRLVIDTTTNHFGSVLDFHRRVREAGGRYLEAPVLGSVIPASKGQLTILASGAGDDFAAARPLLERLGRSLFHLPEPGLASRMKLVNNLVLGGIMAALAEGVAWGEAIGLDRERVLEVLENGAGNSAILAGKKQKLLREDFAPHFSCAMMRKDLRYLEQLADHLGRPLAGAATTLDLYERAWSRGLGDQDFAAVYEIFAGYPEPGGRAAGAPEGRS